MDIELLICLLCLIFMVVNRVWYRHAMNLLDKGKEVSDFLRYESRGFKFIRAIYICLAIMVALGSACLIIFKAPLWVKNLYMLFSFLMIEIVCWLGLYVDVINRQIERKEEELDKEEQ